MKIKANRPRNRKRCVKIITLVVLLSLTILASEGIISISPNNSSKKDKESENEHSIVNTENSEPEETIPETEECSESLFEQSRQETQSSTTEGSPTEKQSPEPTNVPEESVESQATDITEPEPESEEPSESSASRPEESQESKTSEIESEIGSETEDIDKSKWTYYGNKKISTYCTKCNSPKDSYVCALKGSKCEEWKTCATNDLPLGTIIYIDGFGEFLVNDTGSKSLTGTGQIDIFVYPEECQWWKNADVWIISMPVTE